MGVYCQVLKLNRETAIELKHNPQKAPIACRWIPPPLGFVCLNTDGSRVGNPGKAGIGYTLRTETGKSIRVGTAFVGITTNNIAEFLALRTGLLMS